MRRWNGVQGVPGPDVRGVGGTGPRKIQQEASFDDLVPEPTIQMQKLTVEYRQRFPFFF